MDLIKLCILPKKNVHNVIKLKLINPKKHDEQLSITRSSKLLEVTEEFKEFKFWQNLEIEFNKNDEVFKNKIFASPCFDSLQVEFNDINFN